MNIRVPNQPPPTRARRGSRLSDPRPPSCYVRVFGPGLVASLPGSTLLCMMLGGRSPGKRGPPPSPATNPLFLLLRCCFADRTFGRPPYFLTRIQLAGHPGSVLGHYSFGCHTLPSLTACCEHKNIPGIFVAALPSRPVHPTPGDVLRSPGPPLGRAFSRGAYSVWVAGVGKIFPFPADSRAGPLRLSRPPPTVRAALGARRCPVSGHLPPAPPGLGGVLWDTSAHSGRGRLPRPGGNPSAGTLFRRQGALSNYRWPQVG